MTATALTIGGCLCLLAAIYLSCRPDLSEASDERQQNFFAAHDPEQARRDRTQRAELNADARIARGCHWAELYMWETEEPAGVDPRQPAQPETDGPRPGTGTVTP